MIGWFRTKPERLVMALVALAWAWMLGHAVTSARLTCCAPHPSALDDLIAWAAMVVAMMVPTMIAQMRDVAFRSYRARRGRAVLAYLLGYLTWWMLLGIAVCVVRRWDLAHDARAATAVFAFAAAWTLLPVRETWHRRCHRQIVMYPVGPRADVDAFRQGAAHGAPCVAMCWPLMLACTITGHELVVMVGAAVLAVVEKRMYWLRRRPLVIGALVLAAWSLRIWPG